MRSLSSQTSSVPRSPRVREANQKPALPGYQSVPASGTRAIAAASSVSAQRSSGSRLWRLLLPQARAMVCASSVNDLEIVGEAPSGRDRIEPLRQLRILSGDARWVLAFVPVVVGAGCCAELLILRLPARVVVAKGDERRGANRDRIRAKRQRLGHIGARANAAGQDQLHLTSHAELVQRLNGWADAGERRHADMLDEDVLRRRRAPLHAVEHDDVSA